jgi:EmrB/QacA subfamily drug resistance transporter
MLIIARALQGAFGAALAPAALSLLSTTFTEPSERGKAFGIFGAISGAGGAVGLLLGGVLTEYASWRWTLLVSAPIAIVAAVAAVRFVGESRAEGNTRYDLPGAFTSTVGLVALVYGFTKASEDGWSSPVTIAWLVAAVLLLVSFVVIELRSSHPLLPMRVLLDRNRGGAFLASLLIGSGLFGMFLFLTFYMQLTLGYSALMSGVAFLPFTFGIIAGAGVAAQIQTRFGPRVLMTGGLLLATIGMVMLTQIGVDTSFWTHVLPAEVVLSLGMGITFGPMSSTALFGVADHDAGVASALINTTQQIGGSLGTALLNTIFTSAVAAYITDHRSQITNPDQLPALQGVATVHGYTVAFWVSAALIGLSAVLAFVLIRAKREEVAAAPGVPVGV